MEVHRQKWIECLCKDTGKLVESAPTACRSSHSRVRTEAALNAARATYNEARAYVEEETERVETRFAAARCLAMTAAVCDKIHSKDRGPLSQRLHEFSAPVIISITEMIMPETRVPKAEKTVQHPNQPPPMLPERRMKKVTTHGANPCRKEG